jgi:hypothetical protein
LHIKVVLKLLSVESAQNAPLELKQECASVGLLQFGLTAADLRRVVAHAVYVADLAALRAMNYGEPDEEYVEDGGTGVGGTAAERQSHSLVVARIANKARNTAKIKDDAPAVSGPVQPRDAALVRVLDLAVRIVQDARDDGRV